jgi:diadenosine tetraphosphate (Ap4A) HIT family hydrolase
MNDPFINKVLKTAREGTNPTLITKMRSGFLLLGFQQFLPGYVVLFAYPPVSCLNDLSLEERANFLRDMSIAGDALLKCTDAYRINYEILGNESPVLHAHIFPRYLNEKEEYRKGPVWLYKEEIYNSVMFDIEKHNGLIKAIKQEIDILIKVSPTKRFC